MSRHGNPRRLRGRQPSNRKVKARPTTRLLLEVLEDRLAPDASSAHFAIIGDFGSTSQPEADVSTLVHSWNPDFVVTLGDNNYDTGSAAQIDPNIGQYYHDYIGGYQGSFGAGSQTNRFFPVLGNHDWGNFYPNPSGDQPYLNYFPQLPGNQRYYTFTEGPIQFFALDSDQNEPDGVYSNSIQAAWLHGALATSTAPWKVVYFHHSPYSSGEEGSVSYMQWPFQQWGASVVLAGHNHDYERIFRNNITYIVNGAGGAGLLPFHGAPVFGTQSQYVGDYGAMLVDATAGQMTFQFITRTGVVIDSYTMTNPSPAAAPQNLTVTGISNTQVGLTWTDTNTVAQNFVVQRSTDGINFSTIATLPHRVTNYVDSGLSTSTTYYYQVAATNSTGSSPFSTAVSGSTLGTSADAPSNVTTNSPSSSEIDLTWTDNSGGLDSFSIQRSTDGTNFVPIATTDIGVTSFADTGLSAGNYYYRLIGSGTGGSTAFSSVATGILLPAAPTSLSAATASGTEIDLTWTDTSTNEDGFAVYQSLDGVTFTQIATLLPGTTTYASTLLNSSTTYYYYVAAFNSAGSSPSGAASATTNLLPPVPATGLSAAAVNATTNSLSWTDNSANESGFKIYQSTDGVNFLWHDTVGANITTYTDHALTSSTTYYYEVVAYNGAGSSPTTAIASATTMAAPATPTGLTATAISGTKINLSWTDNSSNPQEDNFRIYRSTDGVVYSWHDTVAQNVTTYTDTGLTPGTTYYFEILAVAAVGNSGYSNSASATTLSPPNPASNLKSTGVTGSTIGLSWTSNSGGTETGFKIYRSTDGANFSWHDTVGTGVTTYTDTGLAGGTTYYFQIVAYSSIGNSAPSNTVSSTTASPPAAPSNLSATATSASVIKLTWTSNSGGTETGFKIYKSTNGTSYSWSDSVGQNVTTYNAGGLAAGTTYYFEVLAYNGNGSSLFSNSASATTLALPPAPSGLTATAASASKINLSWVNNSTNTTGIKIYRSTDGVNFSWSSTVGPLVTTYTDTGRAAGTTYWYQVLSYNSVGNSVPSNTASATTMVLPAAASGLTATAIVSNKSTLTWTDNSSNPQEDGFKIYKSTDGVNFSWSDTVGRNVTTYVATGLTGTSYYFQIVSYNAAGNAAPSNTATPGGGGGAGGSSSSSSELAGGIGTLAAGSDSVPQTLGWSEVLGAPEILGVYISNADGSMTADELARIEDAIATFNQTYDGSMGLLLVAVDDPAQANIIVQNAATTAAGGMADGVLGDTEMTYDVSPSGTTDGGQPYLQIGGQVHVSVLEGWNWYTGTDLGVTAGQYDYQSVITHELGHAVGLYHDLNSYGDLNGDGLDTMYPLLYTGQHHRDLSPHDIAWLNHLYAYAGNPGGGDTPENVDALMAGDWYALHMAHAAALATEGAPAGASAPLAPAAAQPPLLPVAATGQFLVKAGSEAALTRDAAVQAALTVAVRQAPSDLTISAAGTVGAGMVEAPSGQAEIHITAPAEVLSRSLVGIQDVRAESGEGDVPPSPFAGATDAVPPQDAPIAPEQGGTDAAIANGSAHWHDARAAHFADAGSRLLEKQVAQAPSAAEPEMGFALDPAAANAALAVVLVGSWGRFSDDAATRKSSGHLKTRRPRPRRS
jgi:fibronectin type 3 domain-containing protein